MDTDDIRDLPGRRHRLKVELRELVEERRRALVEARALMERVVFVRDDLARTVAALDRGAVPGARDDPGDQGPR